METINNKEYLFLKHYNPFFKNNSDYEGAIAEIISKSEGKKIDLLSYLNV